MSSTNLDREQPLPGDGADPGKAASGRAVIARRRWPPRAGRWWPAVALPALIGVAALPWEWSFIDDPGMIAIRRDQQAINGPVGGVLSTIDLWCRSDLSWGLFRPAFWVYAATFYLLPAGPAHAVRFAMFAAVLAAPLVVLAGRGAGRPGHRTRRAVLLWAAAVVVTNGSLYRNLWYSSLQELSGLFFVGLGLLAHRRPWTRALCWLIAAWFKSPFAWLLIAYGGLLLARPGSRRRGAACLALGAGTLAAAAGFARVGSYTSTFGFGPRTLVDNARTALLALAVPALVVSAGAVALRIRPHWPRDPTGPALLLGGLGYLANLMPWQTGAHYAGPYVYLIGVGAVLTLSAPARRPEPADRAGPVGAAGRFSAGPMGAAGRLPVGWAGLARRWPAGLMAVVLAASAAVLVSGVGYVWRNAATTTGLRDCVLGLPDGSIVGYNRREAWDRLNSIVHAHRPASRTVVTLTMSTAFGGVTNTRTFDHVDYYIWEPEYGPGTPSLRSGPAVCRTPLATVYRVG